MSLHVTQFGGIGYKQLSVYRGARMRSITGFLIAPLWRVQQQMQSNWFKRKPTRWLRQNIQPPTYAALHHQR